MSRSAIVNDPVSVKLLVPSPDPPSVISVTAPVTSVAAVMVGALFISVTLIVSVAVVVEVPSVKV